MRAFRSSAIAVGLFLTCVGSRATLRAQLPPEVQVGSRVRVWLPEPNRQIDGPMRRQLLRGTLEEVDDDTLRLVVPGVAGEVAIPRASVRRLDVSRGRPSRLGSAFERAFGGALLGAVFWGAMNDPGRFDGPHYKADWRAAGVGAAWGAGIGAAIGIVWPHEQWRRVRLSR